jgi:hypothetical protein
VFWIISIVGHFYDGTTIQEYARLLYMDYYGDLYDLYKW